MVKLWGNEIYSPVKLWVSPGYCSCQCGSSSTTIFKCYCLSLERYWSWRELQNHFQIALVSWFSFCKPFSSNRQRWKHVWSAFHKSCFLDSTQNPRAVAIHGRLCNFSIHRSCHTFQGFGKVWRVLPVFFAFYIISLGDCWACCSVWMFFLSRCGGMCFFFDVYDPRNIFCQNLKLNVIEHVWIWRVILDSQNKIFSIFDSTHLCD